MIATQEFWWKRNRRTRFSDLAKTVRRMSTMVFCGKFRLSVWHGLLTMDPQDWSDAVICGSTPSMFSGLIIWIDMNSLEPYHCKFTWICLNHGVEFWWIVLDHGAEIHLLMLHDGPPGGPAACTGGAIGAVGGAVPGAAYHAGAGSKGEPGCWVLSAGLNGV